MPQIWPPQCQLCGKLMSYDDLETAYSELEYDMSGPRDQPLYTHRKCKERPADD